MVPDRALSSVFTASPRNFSFFLTVFFFVVPSLCSRVLSRVRVVRRGRRRVVFGYVSSVEKRIVLCVHLLPPGVFTKVMLVPCVSSAASPCYPEGVEYEHPPKPRHCVRASECVLCRWTLRVRLGVAVGWCDEGWHMSPVGKLGLSVAGWKELIPSSPFSADERSEKSADASLHFLC